MKNVMGVDRGDSGYSPLWRLFWVTRTPPNFAVDQVSHPGQITPAAGFEFAVTPMYVNCPNVGPVGSLNTMKVQTFPDLRTTGRCIANEQVPATRSAVLW